MGIELPPDFDLDAVDPYAPTEEQLSVLAGGHAVKINYLRANPAKLEQEIQHLRLQRLQAMNAEDVPEPDIQQSPHDAELDGVLANIDVLAAYNKWIGKSQPDPRGKTKNIMVSCPLPDHPDKNPSADLNLEKGVWHCHACQVGGDKYDLAAIGLGYAWPEGYKTNGTFPELRRQMASEFGFVVKRERGRTTVTELEVVEERSGGDDGGDVGDQDRDPEHDGPGDDDDPTPRPDGGDAPGAPGGTSGDESSVEAGDDEHRGSGPRDSTDGTGADGDDGSDRAHPEAVRSDAPASANNHPEGGVGDVPGGEDGRLVGLSEVRVGGSTSDEAPGEDRPNPLKLVDLEAPVPESIEEQMAPAVELRPDADKLIGEFDLTAAILDWRKIIPEGTFLYEYMAQNCRFDIPHEFHFWNGVQLISFANGYNIQLQDVPPINGNLYTVLVGPTGLGKSRSAGSLKKLLQNTMPWTGTPETPGTGVKVMGGLESGQALIRAIGHEYEDPAATIPGTMISQPNVRGWTMPEEFAGFVKKALRSGSDFKERAIEFFDVGKDGVVATNSIKAGGEIKAHGPFLQITSTTQPEAIHTYLAAEDAVSGFLNRFIFVSGPTRDVRPARWLPTDTPDLTKAEAGLRNIIEFCQVHEGMEMPYTEDGSAAWERLFILVEKNKAVTGPMAVRLDLQLKKLMLLFAINEHKTAIDASIVNRMEPIMSHLMACYSRITGDLYWRSDDDCQNAILKYVHRKNESGAYPRRKEIVDAIKKPVQGRSRFDIMRALDVLDRLEMLSLVKVKPKTGPERQGYKITDTGSAVAVRS